MTEQPAPSPKPAPECPPISPKLAEKLDKRIARCRGAQAGNANALKHGFYARQFRRNEIKDIENQDEDGLRDEINIMRVFIRRMIEKSDPNASLEETMLVLHSLTNAVQCLNRLIHTQSLFLKDPDPLSELLDEMWANGAFGAPPPPRATNA